MLDKFKSLFRKPTPLVRAVREVGEIEQSLLDVRGEIMWAQKREEYYIVRLKYLLEFVQGETK